MIHWISCGYRLASDKNFPTDDPGWVERYASYRNRSIVDIQKDTWKLYPGIKFKVHEYLNDQYALEDEAGYQDLLKKLPVQWNGIINMEINLPFLAEIPYLEAFIDLEPSLMIELCRCVEIRAIPPNSMLFYEGYDGIYKLDKGIVCCEGIVYKR
jgi:hypothetical protein